MLPWCYAILVQLQFSLIQQDAHPFFFLFTLASMDFSFHLNSTCCRAVSPGITLFHSITALSTFSRLKWLLDEPFVGVGLPNCKNCAEKLVVPCRRPQCSYITITQKLQREQERTEEEDNYWNWKLHMHSFRHIHSAYIIIISTPGKCKLCSLIVKKGGKWGKEKYIDSMN